MKNLDEYINKKCEKCKYKSNKIDLCKIVKSKDTGEWNCAYYKDSSLVLGDKNDIR
jgi:hypothetical protein